MTRLQQYNDMQRYLLEEYAEDYIDGKIARRELLKRVLLATGSIAATATVLTQLGCTPSSQPSGAPATALPTGAPQAAAPAATATIAASPTPVVGPAATVGPDNPAIDAAKVQFPGKEGTVFGYLAKPKQAGTWPGVIVVHENAGLTPHIEEVTRRIAKVGFVGLAVDLVSRAGGTAGKETQAISALLFQAKPEELTDDLVSAIAFLKTQPAARKERFGAFGFCFGGGYVYRLSVASPDIAAAVPFYGTPPPADQIPNLRGAISAVYAGEDNRINGTIPDLEAAMKANNKRFTYKIFPGVQHAFHRSTDIPAHMAAAKEAWQLCVDFLTKELKA